VGSSKQYRSRPIPSAPAGGPSGLPFYRRPVAMFSLSLAVLTAIAFAPACRNGFINLDDETYVLKNPHVLEGLTPRNIAWSFGSFYAGNWHPLTWLSLQLDASLWKGQEGAPYPPGFHLTNVLLHVLNTIVLFLVFVRFTGRLGPAAVLAALFAVHPLRVESVAWVAERKDVLSTLFGLLAMLAYASYAAAPSIRRYLAVTLLFALSLLAKPMWVTLPCLLLLLDWWPVDRAKRASPEGTQKSFVRTWWPLVREKLTFFAMAGVSSFLTWIAQRDSAASSLATVPLDTRIVNALESYAGYLVQMFWPVNLAPFYPLTVGSPNYAVLASSVALLLVISALAFGQRHSRPYLLVGWLWFLGTLVPVIGLVQVGSQARADRYTYLPFIGIDLMLVWGLDELACRFGERRLALALAGIVIAVLTPLCWFQIGRWHDDFSLWNYTLRATGENWMAFYNLGVANERAAQGRFALADYQEAVRLNPVNATLRARLGSFFHMHRDYERALDSYEAALRIDPNFAQVHGNLGALLRSCGNPDKAIEHLNAAIRLDPANPETATAYFNVGAIMEERGRLSEASEAYRNAVRLDPSSALYQRRLNDVLKKQS
jgi:tetratricopeptide (TPR) repeat protein